MFILRSGYALVLETQLFQLGTDLLPPISFVSLTSWVVSLLVSHGCLLDFPSSIQ